MPKTIQYASLAEKFGAERDVLQLVLMLISMLEDKFGPFFEEQANKLYGTPDGEPHSLEYTKPQ